MFPSTAFVQSQILQDRSDSIPLVRPETFFLSSKEGAEGPYFLTQARTAAAMKMFTSASSKKKYQPSFINWS